MFQTAGLFRDFHEHHKVTDRPEESVRLALEMGCDVNCGCTYQKILNAYEEGLISKELLQKSAIRLFTTRFLLGMFDETEYDHIPYEVVECREHIELSIEAACKSVVLLKNDGILPLNKKKLKTIGSLVPMPIPEKPWSAIIMGRLQGMLLYWKVFRTM